MDNKFNSKHKIKENEFSNDDLYWESENDQN